MKSSPALILTLILVALGAGAIVEFSWPPMRFGGVFYLAAVAVASRSGVRSGGHRRPRRITAFTAERSDRWNPWRRT